MIGAVVRAVLVAVIATITLVALLQLAPARRPLVLAVYLLVMGGVAVQLLVAWLRLLYPPPPASPFDAALAARPAPPRPPAELDRLARLLALSSASALHAHTRLRSELRPVVADRLRWSLGVDLDRDPEAARAALGEAGWALLARDQRDLPDREAAGLPPAALAELVTNLERIGGPDPEGSGEPQGGAPVHREGRP
ncbi:MAG TPA: hypothetical protein VG846_09430 [Actinomycetota bacterium]|nr:hypothetical protein [Actinomycetota bacterium]